MAKRNLGGLARQLRPFGRTPITEVPDNHGRMVPAEGNNEANYLRRLRADESVEVILAQPVETDFCFFPESNCIQLLDPWEPTPKGAKRQHYTPDYLVKRRGAPPELVEVKWAGALNQPEVQQRITVGMTYAAMHGYKYSLVRGDELAADLRLKNAEFVRRYKHARMPFEVSLRVMFAVRSTRETLTFSTLLAAMIANGQDRRLYFGAIWRLVEEGKLRANWELPFGDDTTIEAA